MKNRSVLWCLLHNWLHVDIKEVISYIFNFFGRLVTEVYKAKDNDSANNIVSLFSADHIVARKFCKFCTCSLEVKLKLQKAIVSVHPSDYICDK